MNLKVKKIFLIRVKKAFVASFLSECFFHKMLEINTLRIVVIKSEIGSARTTA